MRLSVHVVGTCRAKVRFWGIDWWAKTYNIDQDFSVAVDLDAIRIDLPGPLTIMAQGERSESGIKFSGALLVDTLGLPVLPFGGTLAAKPVTRVLRTTWKGGECKLSATFGLVEA